MWCLARLDCLLGCSKSSVHVCIGTLSLAQLTSLALVPLPSEVRNLWTITASMFVHYLSLSRCVMDFGRLLAFGTAFSLAACLRSSRDISSVIPISDWAYSCTTAPAAFLMFKRSMTLPEAIVMHQMEFGDLKSFQANSNFTNVTETHSRRISISRALG